MKALERHLKLIIVFLIFFIFVFGVQGLVNSTHFQKLLLHSFSRTVPLKGDSPEGGSPKGGSPTIDFERLRFKIARGEISLKKVVVSNPQGLHAEVDSLILRLSPLSLLRGKFLVSKLDLEGVRLQLPENRSATKRDLGPITLASLRSQLEQLGFLRSLIVDHARIRNLTLSSQDQAPVSIAAIELSLSPHLLTEFGWDLTLRVDEIGREGKEILKLFETAVSLDKDRFRVDSLKVAREGLAGHLEGEARFRDLKKVKLEFRIGLEIPNVLQEPLKISLKASSEPSSLGGSPKGESPSGEPPSLFLIQELKAQMGGAFLEGRGFFDLAKKEYRLPFTARHLPLQAIFGKSSSPILHHSVAMADTVEGEASGRLPQLRAKANVTLLDFRHLAIAAEKATGEVAVDWPRLSYEAKVDQGGSAAWGSTGHLLFKGKNPKTGRLKCHVEKIDVHFSKASLEKILPEGKLAGALSGSLVLADQGALLKGTGHGIVENVTIAHFPIQKITASLQLQERSWLLDSVEVIHSEERKWLFENPVHLEVGDEKVHITARPKASFSFVGDYLIDQKKLVVTSLDYGNPYGSLKASGSIQSPALVEASFKGPLPAADLGVFESVFKEGEGALLLDFRLKGSFPHLAAQGSLEFQKTSLGFRNLRGRFSNLTGRLLMNGSEVTLQGVQGELDEGDFSASGKVGLQELSPTRFDLDLKARDINFVIPGELKLELTTTLSVKGSTPSPTIRGSIDLTEGKYSKKFTISELVIKPVRSSREEVFPWPSWLESSRLDIEVKNSGDLKIQNNLVNRLSLLSDLHLHGILKNPVLTGSINVVQAFGREEGIIRLLGTRFQVTEGRIDFSDPYRINPRLEITAQQYLDDITSANRARVGLKITGPMDNLKLVPLTTTADQRDFSCLIFYGVTCREAQQGGSKRSGGTIASSLVGEQISSLVDESLTGPARLDIFRLETGGADQATVSKVTVGKTLTDRLNLEFTTDFAPETAERTVKTNYFLTDHILLSARRTRTAEVNNRYRFNLIFRFEGR
ncbi:MAG: translocation/assembly module TamB domain-containing protein [Deltaproteobacteria bacterium]|nr:translocation/assembly module TamB domain-containing protein [Deltaproteobacteria bacterium]